MQEFKPNTTASGIIMDSTHANDPTPALLPEKATAILTPASLFSSTQNTSSQQSSSINDDVQDLKRHSM